MSVPTSSAQLAANDAFRVQLIDQHVAIDREARELLARGCDDRPTLCTRFRALERHVLDHFAGEEAAILPDYSTYAPSDARAIRHEHAMIRALLATIGDDVEIRTAALMRLIDLLRAHAAHENAEMYAWVERRFMGAGGSR
jgi:hypothetical protein